MSRPQNPDPVLVETERSSGTLSEGGEAESPMGQWLAGHWDRLAPVVGKAGAILLSSLAAAIVQSVIARSNGELEVAAAADKNTVPRIRWWNSNGYYRCTHQGCKKKVSPTIFGHDCCGCCWSGQDCRAAAQRDYDGPGSFAHNYFEVFLYPGICDTCGEPPAAHMWVFDFHTGDRLPRRSQGGEPQLLGRG